MNTILFKRYFVLAIPFLLAAHVAYANGAFSEPTVIQFDTDLISLNLSTGPYPMPLASDPGNALGDSINGYGFVDAMVSISLSSQRGPGATPPGPGPPSTGSACATNGEGANGLFHVLCSEAPADPIDPVAIDSQSFFVESFFDVFFDITVTDVDDRPGRDFAGQPDGASILLPDNGPTHLLAIYDVVFDAGAPHFGLYPPPQAAPYLGFQLEIPLGGDINGNGENDKIKFTIISHAVGDENRALILLPGGTVSAEFDLAAFMEGAIVDESTDPPFTLGAGSIAAPAFSGPGALTGPTTATSTLLNPIPDADGDGVFDGIDLCPGTAPADLVDMAGCSDVQVDADGDGVCAPGAPSGGPSGCTGDDWCGEAPPGDFTSLEECVHTFIDLYCSGVPRRDQTACHQAQLDACTPGCQEEPEPPSPPRR